MASTDRTICTFCTTYAIAIATCTSCTEQLCELCVATHKSARMFKGHDVVTMSPGPDQARSTYKDITEDKCVLCNRDYIGFYCEKHDYVGCGACTRRHHTLCGENVSDLLDTDTLKIPTSKLDKLRSESSKFDDEIDEAEIYVSRNTNTCRDEEAKCLADVKSFRARIDKELNQLQSKIEQGIRDTYRDIEKKQNQEASDLFGSAKKSNHQFKEELDTASERNQPTRVYIIYRRSINSIEKFRSEIERLKRSIHVEKLEFTPDQTLKATMLSKVKSFGSIGIRVVGSEEAPMTEAQSYAGHGASKQGVRQYCFLYYSKYPLIHTTTICYEQTLSC